MRFFDPQMLFAVWIAPLLGLVLIHGMLRRKRLLERFSSAKGLLSLAPGASPRRRWIKGGLMLGVLIFLSLALAGPQYGFRWQEIEQRGVDLILALDCSRSMTATDIGPTRLDRAKREIYDLLNRLQGDRVGLVAFSGTAFLQCPLTLDYSGFHIFLDALTPDFLPVGGTDIPEALRTAQAAFDPKANTDKAVILITDGENTGSGDPIEAAQELQKAGIKLFCIGVGAEEGVPIPAPGGGFQKDAKGDIVLSRLDEPLLKKIAVITRGTYVRSVAGDMDLDVIYAEEIRGKMERERVTSGRKQVWEDRFQWFLLAALVLFIAEIFISPKARVTVGIIAVLMVPVIADAGPAQDGLEAYEKGDYEAALKHLIDAQLEDPDNPDLLYDIGNAYYRNGEYEMAIRYYGDAIERAPQGDQKLKANALYNIGNAQFRKEQAEEAIKSYEKTLEIAADDLQARENIEFVKAWMEQQKKQQPSQKSQKKDQDEKSDGEEQSPEEGSEEESEEQEESQPQPRTEDSPSEESNSEKSNSEKSGEPERDQPPEDQKGSEENGESGQEPDLNPPEETGAPQSAEAKEDQKDPDQKGNAARMLNRLEDQPGKAMIPAYGERKVEKDW